MYMAAAERGLIFMDELLEHLYPSGFVYIDDNVGSKWEEL